MPPEHQKKNHTTNEHARYDEGHLDILVTMCSSNDHVCLSGIISHSDKLGYRLIVHMCIIGYLNMTICRTQVSLSPLLWKRPPRAKERQEVSHRAVCTTKSCISRKNPDSSMSGSGVIFVGSHQAINRWLSLSANAKKACASQKQRAGRSGHEPG